MTYPELFEEKIDFTTIRDIVSAKCLCSLGVGFVRKMRFVSDYNTINLLLSQTDEFRMILHKGESFPSQDYIDVTPELKRIAVEGTTIELDALFDLKRSLQTIRECLKFFQQRKEDSLYPCLYELSQNYSLDNEIPEEINKILDDKGIIKDSASVELLRIRKELINKQNIAGRRIRSFLLSSKKDGFSPDDAEVTIRNGRLVIPVLAAYKRKIRGYIHDESSTGQTVYIEPEVVYEANNELRELAMAEKQEIFRILHGLTVFLQPRIPTIISAYNFLGLVDFIRAKALFAFDTSSQKPYIHDFPQMEWIDAYHPLLYLSHKSDNKSVIPMNLKLDSEDRILVVSGPNAGGKSVCLKTTGLLQYMLQCGMLIPVSGQSHSGIFQQIFIDIGDEQSIENDLSTYSSHLLNMRYFVNYANKATLFLIDEFGTGTEPKIGGAIAEAVLEELNKKKAFGVITTHYANIKSFAANTSGLINGAMLFDAENLMPLFVLKTGNPGSSFAFEIAAKIGLQKEILASAKEKSNIKELDLEKQLQDLQVQKITLDKKSEQIKVAEEFLNEMIEKYQNLSESIKRQKTIILEKAYNEAKKIIAESNSIVERTIKEIKENKAEKESTKKARNSLKNFSKNLSEKDKSLFDDSSDTIADMSKYLSSVEKKSGTNNKCYEGSEIDKGDSVRIKGQSAVGEVISCDKKEAIVVFGAAKIKTPLSNIEKVKNEDKNKKHQNISYITKHILELDKKISTFKTITDVRGFKADDTLVYIQKYIDEALLLNIPSVRILHGKGNGILRKIVREYLQSVKEVKGYRDETIENGGHGITVVSFRE